MDANAMKDLQDMVTLRTKFYEDLDAGKLDLAETLKRMRKLLGKNQAEFASLIDLAPGVIQGIEQRRANPTLATLEKIGRPFGLSLQFRRRPRDES